MELYLYMKPHPSIPSKVKLWPILTGGLPGTPAWRSAAREMWMDQPPPQELRNWDRSDARPYPPGNGYISHQTGSLENHRLKMPIFGGYVSSLEGNIH